MMNKGFTFTLGNYDYFIITARTRRTVDFLRDVLRILGVEDPEPFTFFELENMLQPALYGQIADMIDGANAVLDYGCGKFFDAYHMPAKVSGYDPFNRDAVRNGAAIARDYDLIVCANVLNVIKEDTARAAVLEDIAQHLTPSGVACFSIYEGDRSGSGRVTMRGCYQLNRKAAAYRAELERVFPVVRRVRGHYECRTA